MKNVAKQEMIYAGLMGVFVTFVVLTNTVGVKLFTLGSLVLPVSVVWFPLTFLITDITSEVFGRKRASSMVVMGFAMSVVLLLFILIGISLPASEVYALDDAYKQVFSPTWRLLFASMTAYLLAQLADVHLFHFVKRLTKGRHLWLRNNVSTMISQLIDTATVNLIFLWGNDAVFSGDLDDILSIIGSVYLFKLLIAAADTPFCYAGVWLIKRYQTA